VATARGSDEKAPHIAKPFASTRPLLPSTDPIPERSSPALCNRRVTLGRRSRRWASGNSGSLHPIRCLSFSRCSLVVSETDSIKMFGLRPSMCAAAQSHPNYRLGGGIAVGAFHDSGDLTRNKKRPRITLALSLRLRRICQFAFSLVIIRQTCLSSSASRGVWRRGLGSVRWRSKKHLC
jgi:hypothetical protein